MNLTIPVARVRVAASISSPAATSVVRRGDAEFGLGDLILSPLMLNYQFSDDFNANGRVNVYAPTGSYEVGRLANLGKNYWTFEPPLRQPLSLEGVRDVLAIAQPTRSPLPLLGLFGPEPGPPRAGSEGGPPRPDAGGHAPAASPQVSVPVLCPNESVSTPIRCNNVT